MESNYETRYTKKEFEIIQLKREMKTGAMDLAADLLLDDPRQEMNELVESDPELYAADSDSSDLQRPGFNDDLSEDEFDSRDRRLEGVLEERDDLSLMSEREGRARLMSRKNRDAKINNSFTGPYPLDPTEFGHNDKGANA